MLLTYWRMGVCSIEQRPQGLLPYHWRSREMRAMTAPPSFRPTCPSCKRGEGVPNTVGISGTERTVTFRCVKCEHSWTARDTVSTLIPHDPLLPPPPVRP